MMSAFKAIIVVVFLGINTFFVYEDFFQNNPDPVYTLGFLLVSLVAILVLCVLLISNRSSTSFMFTKHGKQRISKLRKRIIIAFSIGAALPTIVVAVFSTYFFNFGIEAWFDKKISRVLDQSIHVGESYIAEHVLQIKETAISVADDLSAMYYDLIHSPELFSKVLNAQAEMRSLDEAIVFQKDNNTILAQTTLSFSLSFTTIPLYLIERADRGEVVQIDSDPTKIRILIKLRDYNNTYLLIGRLIDSRIIDHIDQANGAAEEYFRLRDQIQSMQIKFSMVFILLSAILLFIAIAWGRRFAERIVLPIRELVKAAEKVKNGDFVEHSAHHSARYGTLKSEIDAKLAKGSILLDVDVNGANSIKTTYPDAVVIYVDAPSAAELKRRLLARGTETLNKVNKRILRYRTHEKAFRDCFDYRTAFSFIYRSCRTILCKPNYTGFIGR